VAVRLAQTQQQVRVLEASDRLRSDLLANVSHELRTPLASILTGATDLLGRPRLPPPCMAMWRRSSARPAASSGWSRSARHGPHRGTRADHRPGGDRPGRRRRAAAARLRLASRAGRWRSTCPRRAGGARRLGSTGTDPRQPAPNADRHAPPGTPITVEAAPGKRSMVVIRVIDQGRGAGGAAGADLRALRARCDRRGDGGDRPRAVPSGTGLGLAIVEAWSRPTPDGCGSRIRRRARARTSRSPSPRHPPPIRGARPVEVTGPHSSLAATTCTSRRPSAG